ncbi:uncharacterized protein LOC124169676 [Ischnura elegans]|uniref:uncharacterized protein LOC124169676 n=1 Tax=Ischnura elegans TaxID=197161 RepID=UPI001ED8B272|nr:uncharacterized protein LOC124169676 [Ischnura elegans]
MAEVVRRYSTRAALFLLCLQVLQVESKDGGHGWRSNELHHNILSIDSSCTKEAMDVTIGFASPPDAPQFRGAIHARGFPRECRSAGSNGTSSPEGHSSRVVFLKLKLPAESCGVRVVSREDGLLAYQVEVDIQFDRNLQQSVDQSRTITCILPREINSDSSNVAINPEVAIPHRRRGSYRSGRTEDSNAAVPPRGLQAWMEVHGIQRGGGKLPRHRTYFVGEHLTMSVKSFLPNGIGARVINCTAHDGRVKGPEQRLLDGKGCPLDAGIMPAPTAYRRNLKRPVSSSQRRTYPTYEAATSFLAFKFPDRDFLHLRCWLRICKGSCKPANCSSQQNYYEEVYDEYDENEITRLEVFNSLNVKAPSIEVDATQMDSYSRKEAGNADVKGTGGRLLCMSPSKLALAFAILGIIFLVAIAVSVYVCLRSRHKRRGWQSSRGSYFGPPPSLSRSSSNASFFPNHNSSCPFFRSAR